MIKNDAQMESKLIQNRPKGWSKVDAKINAKSMQNGTLKRRVGGKGVSPLSSTQSPYLVLVSQTHISTTNQTLKTARRHRYADARPDLSAPCGASTAAPSLCRSAVWCVRLLQLLAFCKTVNGCYAISLYRFLKVFGSF